MAFSKQSLQILDEVNKIAHSESTHIDEDAMTPIIEIMLNLLNAKMTTKDLAKHYGISEDNLRHIINRRPIPDNQKPTRSKTYSFSFINSIIPHKWKKESLTKARDSKQEI